MGQKKKILIVDDEKDLTVLLESAFLSTGIYEADIANDGEEGKQKALSKKPDLIFLDYIMPKARGDEVLQFIRSQDSLKETKVVIMSGLGGAVYFDSEEVKKEALEVDLGMDGNGLLNDADSIAFPKEMILKYKVSAVLPKPFSLEKLLDVTKRLLGD